MNTRKEKTEKNNYLKSVENSEYSNPLLVDAVNNHIDKFFGGKFPTIRK